MFSPYYAAARARGPAEPSDHCAVNVALYGEGPRRRAPRRWCMTERGRAGLKRAPDALSIGPSVASWDGETLTVEIDEIAVPLPRRIRGVVRVRPEGLTAGPYAIDGAGRHRWWPIAPSARVEVALERPNLHWSGPGYLDRNTGDEPLETGFVEWDWCRAALPDGAAVLYDTLGRDGVARGLALRFGRDGSVREFAGPPPVDLPRTGWRVNRRTRADAGHAARVARTLEDTPFYARSLVDTRLLGQPVRAVHESLALDRFRTGWVRALLPFRMPRRR